MEARNQLLGMAAQEPQMLTGVRPNGQEDTSQYRLYIDLEKAQAQGVAVSDIYSTLGTMFGGSYVNDFIDRGRVKKVYVQAESQFRMLPQDIANLYVRNNAGQMVPFILH